MDPKRLLLAHGEKVVVAVVAVIAGLSAYESFTDASIRPKGINQQDIQDGIDLIKKVMLSADAPAFKPPLPYLQNMQGRFAQELPKPQRLSWIMAHPDVGGGPGGTYFYIFELNQPAIDAKDDIGKLEVTLTPPASSVTGGGGSDSRRAAADIEWPRQSEKGQIVNSAKIAGIQVEMKIGQQDFHPLTAPGITGGFITLDQMRKIGNLLKFASDATWQPVSFRVRSVLKATGYTGDNPDADETVLVHAGPMDAEPDWTKLSGECDADPAKFLGDFLAFDDANPPPGVVLAPGQHLYYSDWTSPVTVVVTANVRFAFEKVTPDPANPANELGVFLVSKQYQTATGNVWLDKPVEFKVPFNQVVGGKVKVHTPTDPAGFVSEEDLSTPFELVGVDHDQPRTWFWEIHAKTPPAPANGAPAVVGNAKAKVLELEAYPHDHKIDVAVLKNTKTGELLHLPKLEKLLRPTDSKVIYAPLLQTKIYDEAKEFDKSPAGFVQREMEPTKPELLDPADPKGPLVLLSKGDSPVANVAESNTPYAQLSDGRLVWWNDLNAKLLQYPEPVVGKDDSVTEAPPPPASHAHLQPSAPRHRPSGGQPYQPPGPSGGPPGGPPGGFPGQGGPGPGGPGPGGPGPGGPGGPQGGPPGGMPNQ